jgi:hypothetical protein
MPITDEICTVAVPSFPGQVGQHAQGRNVGGLVKRPSVFEGQAFSSQNLFANFAQPCMLDALADERREGGLGFHQGSGHRISSRPAVYFSVA